MRKQHMPLLTHYNTNMSICKIEILFFCLKIYIILRFCVIACFVQNAVADSMPIMGKKLSRLWVAHHSDKLPKKALISLIHRQKTWQSTKDSCGFFLVLGKPSSFLGASQF